MAGSICIDKGYAWVITHVGTPIGTIKAINAAVFYNKNGNVQERDLQIRQNLPPKHHQHNNKDDVIKEQQWKQCW